MYLPNWRILLLISVIVLSGCNTRTAVIKQEKSNIPKLNISDPEPLKFDRVHVFVLTTNNVHDILLENNGVLYAFSVNDYKNMSMNLRNTVNYIKDQKIIIQSYREFYEEYINVQ